MKKGLKQRDWNEIKTNDSWSIFKIMGEFVQGFETLQRIGPCVSIYGSARMAEDSTVYNQSREVARQLSARGYGVITGGGPGVMEAGNRGAHDVGGTSVGLNIELPHRVGGCAIRISMRTFFGSTLFEIDGEPGKGKTQREVDACH